MAPITLQRLVKELDKLKQETDAGRLKSQDAGSHHGSGGGAPTTPACAGVTSVRFRPAPLR